MHLLLLAVCIAGRLENVRKIRRRVLTVSIKRHMKFHLVVVQWRQRNVQKVCCTCLLSYEYDSRFFHPRNKFLDETSQAVFCANIYSTIWEKLDWKIVFAPELASGVSTCLYNLLYFSLHGPRSDNAGQGSRIRKSSRYLEYWMCCGGDGNRKGTQNF